MGVKVITPPTVEPVTLAEAKLALRVDSSDLDVQIARNISAVRAELEHYFKRTIAPTTYQLTLEEWPTGDIHLPLPPVTSVTSVQYVDMAGITQTWAGSNWALDDTSVVEHYLRRAYGVSYPEARQQWNAITISYVAGWSAAACPPAIKDMILAYVGTRLKYAESDSDKPAMTHEFVSQMCGEWRIHVA
jgi:uncharacterized phiE125 gp8 family phage protein